MLKKFGFEVVKVRKLHPVIQILFVILGIIVALAISGVFIALANADPIESFLVMFNGAFGEKRKIWETLLRSSPIMLTGLATVIAFRAEIWSIGQEGQLFAGGMLSYAMYRTFQPILERPALVTVIVLGGFFGGALLGWLSGWMRARFKVDIIISTVLLNYIVITILQFLVFSTKYWMGTVSYYPRTDIILEEAWYPILTQDARLHMGFLIAIGLALLVYWVMKRTPYGFELRALGSNPVATYFKGIDVNKLIVVTMFISGGLAGLAGAGEVFGVHHSLNPDISTGYGYTGIIVAMVAELNPLIVILVAIIFGGLIHGSVLLVTATQVHTSIIFVIQAFVLLSVLVSRALMTYRIRRVANVS